MRVDGEIRWLRSFRVDHGITQAEIARLMSTTQAYVARLESGRNDPRLSTLQRYRRAISDAIWTRRARR